MAPKQFPGTIVTLLLSSLALVQCSLDPDPLITAGDGAEMVFIPAGEFDMGGKREDLQDRPRSGYLNYEAEYPLHRVKLSPFYLDKHEVTNALYRRFLEDIEGGGDTSFNHPDQPANFDHRQKYMDENLDADDQPAVGLNWFDAYAYCRWAGKRLPTEAEWEYAARGGDGIYRKYPWGNEDPNADGIWWANYRPDAGPAADSHRYTAPVGSYPDGVSPFGIMDMAGNAEEWVHDWWGVNYYRLSDGAQDPQGPASGRNGNKVIKGGSFSSDKYHIRIATRLYGAPHVKTEKQGFRCAMDL